MKFSFYLIRPSRKTVRIFGWLFFVLFFVTVCLPLLFFYYLFDADKVKHMVISQFNNHNYSVVIHGNVEPRSWHGLSLFISDLTVEDKTAKKILHINTANCQLSWIDLIVGHYRVKRVALNGLNLYQDDIHKEDYVSLIDYQTLAKSEFKKLNYISISNLNLIDLKNNFLIRDASLYITSLHSKPRIKLQFKMAQYGSQVTIFGQAIKKDPGSDSLIIKKLNTVISASNGLHINLNSEANYAYKSQELWLYNTKSVIDYMNFHGTASIKDLLLSSYGMTMDSVLTNLSDEEKQKTINVQSGKTFTADFVNYTTDFIATKYLIKVQNNHLETNLQLKNVQWNSNHLDIKNDSCQLDFRSIIESSHQLAAVGFMAGDCGYSGESNLLDFNLKGTINKGKAQLNLSYQEIKNKPMVKLNGRIDRLDLSKLVESSQSNLLPLYADSSKLPFGWFNELNADADLKFKHLNLSHLSLTNVDTHVTIKDSTLKVDRLKANAYGGTINGSAIIDNLGDVNNIRIINTISDVNLQELFASWFNVSAISGRGNVTIDASANNVGTYEDLHKKLNGKIALSVSNGGFSGIDFSLFLSPENLAAFQDKNSIKTSFSRLDAKFTFESGVSKDSPLVFSSPTIMAKGSGMVDFANTKLSYRLNVSSSLPKNAQNVKSISIPLLIKDDLFKPQIYIESITLNTADTHKNWRKDKLSK